MISAESATKHLGWRYATKKFDPARKIAPAVWQQLETALVLSPSSYGLQPWKFFVVTNSAVRTKLREAAWGQPQITDASHLVVFSVKKNVTPAEADRWVKRIAEVRQMPVESLDGMKGMMAGSISRQSPAEIEAWLSRQVYIALGVFLTTAALLEVDACPMEGFENAKFDDILGLPAKGYGSVVLGAAGYRADDPYATAAKVRYPHSEIIEHFD